MATSMSQDGCAGNRNVTWAASFSAVRGTTSPDSSSTSRVAAAAVDSPGSTWPPSPTTFPWPSPVFLWPSRTWRVPSPRVPMSRHRQVDRRGIRRLSQTGSGSRRGSGGIGGQRRGHRVVFGREGGGAGGGRAPEPGGQCRGGEHRADGPFTRGAQRGRVPPGRGGSPPDGGCHHGYRGAQRLLQRERLTLPPAGQHEHGRGGQPRGHVGDLAEDRGGDAERVRPRPQRRRQGAVPGDHDQRLRVEITPGGGGVQQRA